MPTRRRTPGCTCSSWTGRRAGPARALNGLIQGPIGPTRRRRFMARAHHCGGPRAVDACARSCPRRIHGPAPAAQVPTAPARRPERATTAGASRRRVGRHHRRSRRAAARDGLAIASGVTAEQGLITAIVAGFLISATGGSNVQIGGTAGAFIVIIYGIVQRYGLTNLLIATALSGVLLFAMGALRLGALVRYVPVSIIIGFTNGIAVLIGLSQVKDCSACGSRPTAGGLLRAGARACGHLDTFNPVALSIGAAAWRWSSSGPSPTPCLLDSVMAPPGPPSGGARPRTIVALALATLATAMLGLPIETIGSRFGGIPQSLPELERCRVQLGQRQATRDPDLTLALLGAIELPCARASPTTCRAAAAPRPEPGTDGPGRANMVTLLFGGSPATGTIARTVTKRAPGRDDAGRRDGARADAAGGGGSPLAQHVPLAAMGGIPVRRLNMGERREARTCAASAAATAPSRSAPRCSLSCSDLTVAVEVGPCSPACFHLPRQRPVHRQAPHRARPAAGCVSLELFGSCSSAPSARSRPLPSRWRKERAPSFRRCTDRCCWTRLAGCAAPAALRAEAARHRPRPRQRQTSSRCR